MFSRRMIIGLSKLTLLGSAYRQGLVSSYCASRIRVGPSAAESFKAGIEE